MRSFQRKQQTRCIQSKYTISGTAHLPRAGGARDCGRRASYFSQRPCPSEGPCRPRPLPQHPRPLPRHRLQRPPASRRFVTSSVCSRLRSKSVFSLCSRLAHLTALIALSFFIHSTANSSKKSATLKRTLLLEENQVCFWSNRSTRSNLLGIICAFINFIHLPPGGSFFSERPEAKTCFQSLLDTLLVQGLPVNAFLHKLTPTTFPRAFAKHTKSSAHDCPSARGQVPTARQRGASAALRPCGQTLSRLSTS